MSPLEDLLEQCTVKLSIRGQMGWGTGFFVAPELILTCAHVVRAKGKPVQVRWQKQENWSEAVVEDLLPDPYDLALLRVMLPTDANPPCVYLDEAIQSRDPLYLFGYPDQDFPNGCPVTLNCEGLTGDEPELIKLALGQVRPGMSGAPLLNQRTGKVCGMVKFTRDRSFDLGGGAVPTAAILEQFPQLREFQQQFHQRDRRWRDLVLKQTEIDFQSYLTASTTRYKQWWQLYTLTDAEGKQRSQSEVKLLNFVKTEIASRLAQSLHKQVYLEINKTFDLNQVTPPWKVDIKVGNKPTKRCPDDTHIIEVFDKPDISGRLLILGAPGSGKTTMLLQLAEVLVRRCITNVVLPVPVLLNLSTWNQKFVDISTWILSDLKLKYGVREDIAKNWIKEERILPLLDGLDELISERQETCIEAINDFLNNWSSTPIVVCSRSEEYQICETNLALNGAAILQPLTDNQISQYLLMVKCEWLWNLVQNDKKLIAKDGLLRTPLMLTILVISSRKIQPQIWKNEQNLTIRRKIWVEAFIADCLSRQCRKSIDLSPKKNSRLTTEQEERIKHWLGCLARILISSQKTEFFIEELQPRLLSNRFQLVIYGLIGGMVGGTFGSLVGFIFLGLIFDIKFGAAFGFSAAMVAGLFYANFGEDTISPSNSIILSIKAFHIKRLSNNFLNGIRFGVFYGVIFGIIYLITKSDIKNGCLLSLIYCLFYGIIYTISKSVTYAEVDVRKHDNQGIRRSLSNSLILCLLSIPVGILMALSIKYFKIVELNTWEILIVGCGCGYFGLDSGGFSATCKHISLRISLYLFGYSPLNYSKFLRYCTEQGLLQRVGGGYRFVHSLLREHFATYYDSSPK
ncbi:MAG: trypsin-like peptidase domain-containing protein [Coleofasciculus sp. C1-SOL-03]